jgi:hypothetical protein
MQTLRLLLANLAHQSVGRWVTGQFDISTAYLNGDLDEDIYIDIPDGWPVKRQFGDSTVLHLLKSVYGLKQAGRNWNKNLDDYLVLNLGFVRSPNDHCLYSKRDKQGRIVFVAVFVDDLFVFASDPSLIPELHSELEKKYKVKFDGALSWILGISIHIKPGLVQMSQESYIDSLVERFNMVEAAPAKSPLPSVTLNRSQCPTEGSPEWNEMQDKPYRQMIGALNYLAVCTRPDIAYAISLLSRFSNNPGIEHWKAAQKVVKYLKGTSKLAIQYDGTVPRVLEGYADASFAPDTEDRKSYTGYVMMVNGGPVAWYAKLQPIVTVSSCESEYVALTVAVQEIVYLRKLLTEMFPEAKLPPTVCHEDNQACISMIKNPTHHSRTKHIDIKYHYTREQYALGTVIFEYIESKEQLADLFTKGLSDVLHMGMVKKLLVGLE